MKSTLLMILTFGAVAVCLLAEPNTLPQSSSRDASPPSAQESTTLAEACRLTKRMNEGQWDEVEAALDNKAMVTLLRQQASAENWPGIGAYRGTTVEYTSPLKITHRFGFAPRTNPHEIRLTYTLGESGISKPSLNVLGW